MCHYPPIVRVRSYTWWIHLYCIYVSLVASQELLKYTDRSHPDYDHIKSAVDVMKEVAQTVNERKRRVENIHFIGKWRRSVDNWEVSSYRMLHYRSLVELQVVEYSVYNPS